METLTPSIRENKAEALKFFNENGFLIERDLVPGTWCQELIDLAKSLPSGQDGTFNPIPMPHLVHEEFLENMRLPQIVSIAESLVGGPASGIGGEFFFMRPGTPGFTHHQDNTYVQAPPDEFISAWTALTEVDRDNGGLTFFPGSHNLGLLPTRSRDEKIGVGQNPGARAAECLMPRGLEPIDVVIKTGSTAFFHSLLVHYSNSNITKDRFRYSILATYIQKGRPFRPGTTQKRTEINLHP